MPLANLIDIADMIVILNLTTLCNSLYVYLYQFEKGIANARSK